MTSTSTLNIRYDVYPRTPLAQFPPKQIQLKTRDDSQSSFADLVVVDPEDFSKHTADALEDQINAKYANKVPPPPNHRATTITP